MLLQNGLLNSIISKFIFFKKNSIFQFLKQRSICLRNN
ncbi:hypothetical protein LEP1GSC013_0680 [Leptospira interrogans serovar Valbuzzi str. Duyster]|nr:hypothetical protein LEP1GSC013_0680 [Leptospira interrogans serovar Valbuzzi str. Duyster]ENO70483.1 hypothetical protein LEP1GSC012_0678 [Leptospira interrogans serovar Valbuzzi str. Valbuzzi]